MHFFRMGGGDGKRGLHQKLNDGGTWLDATTWPVPASTTKYFLNDNSRLQKNEPTGHTSSTLIYDPANPAPTIGGRYGMEAGVRTARKTKFVRPLFWDARMISRSTNVQMFSRLSPNV